MAGTADFTSEAMAIFLGEAGLKSTFILLIAWQFCRAMRASSAAIRHQIWCLGCFGALLLPVVTATGPQFHVPILPQRTAAVAGRPMPAVEADPVEDPPAVVASSITLAPETLDATSGLVAANAIGTAAPEAPETGNPRDAIVSQLPTRPEHRTSTIAANSPRTLNIALFTPYTVVVLAWLTGFLLVLIPAFVAWIAQRLLITSANRVFDRVVLDLLKDCSVRIGVTSQVALLECERFMSPLTIGVLRPVIVFPADWRSWSMERLRCVLMHELAHIHRRDVLLQTIARCAATIYWFNPLAWHALRRMRIERELACDDRVIDAGESASAYAQQLLDLARTYRSPQLAFGVAITRSPRMEERIVSLLASNSSHRPAGRRFLWGSAAAAACLVALISLVRFAEVQTVASEPVTGATKAQSPVPAPESKSDVTAEQKNQTGNQPASSEAQNPLPRKLGSKTIRVKNVAGQPIKDAEIYWFSTRVHDLRPMKPQLLGTTDAEGRTQIAIPTNPAAEKGLPASWEYQASIYIKAKGRGFVRGSYELLSPPTTFLESLTQAAATSGSAVLPPAGKSLQGRIVDVDGKPVAGATVQIRWFVDANDPAIVNDRGDNAGSKDPLWSSRLHNLLNVIEPEPLRHLLPSAQTNADGRFELADIGENRVVQLLVRGDQIASTEIVAFNGSDKDVIVLPDRHQRGKPIKVFGRQFEQVAGPSKPVEGKVVDLDTGEPISDAIVRAFAIHGDQLHSSRERDEYATRTDKDGKYRLTGLPMGKGNQLAILTDGAIAYLPVAHKVDTSQAQPNTNHDFALKRGVWATGRVHDVDTRRPLAGELSYYHFGNADFESQVPGFREAFVDGCYWTNLDGEFRVPVAPIRGILAFRFDGPDDKQEVMGRYPGGYGSQTIAGGGEDQAGLNGFPTRPHHLIPSNYMRVAEVVPVEGQLAIDVDMSIKASQPVTVSVVDSKGKPVLGFEVYGAAERWGWQKKEGIEFTISDLKANERRKVLVVDQVHDLAGGVIVSQPADEPLKVELQPAGYLAGRLVDESGEPITDASLVVKYEKLKKENDAGIWANHPNKRANPTTIPIDNEGRFLVRGLIPGWKYSADISAPRKLRGEIMNLIIGTAFDDATIDPGERKDLGDIVIKSTAEK